MTDILTSSIYAALQRLDLPPDDERVLFVFRNDDLNDSDVPEKLAGGVRCA